MCLFLTGCVNNGKYIIGKNFICNSLERINLKEEQYKKISTVLEIEEFSKLYVTISNNNLLKDFTCKNNAIDY